MFPRRYFPAAAFAPRFFPQSAGTETVASDYPGGTFRRDGDTARVFRRDGDTARVFGRVGDTARVFRGGRR